MRILVTGGAGYIGSVVTEQLVNDGHQVVVYDSLYKGHRAAIVDGAAFIQAELSDNGTLRRTLREHRVDAVMHMAADSLVGESIVAPEKYYQNNVATGLTLLEAMRECSVDRLVFSSTAAVFGEPEKQPKKKMTRLVRQIRTVNRSSHSRKLFAGLSSHMDCDMAR